MKTKLRSLTAAAVGALALLVSRTAARANEHGGSFPHPLAAAVRFVPRAIDGFRQSWQPRPIRCVALLPFSTVCAAPREAYFAPSYGRAFAPEAPIVVYNVAPRPEPVITITVPVSAVRDFLASGAIKLSPP